MELEVKVPCEDLNGLEERLKRMGLPRLREAHQVDLYFGHPVRDFASTDEALRLRCEKGRTLVTYKGPKLDKDTKLREEIEVEVGDLDRAALLLQRLGFRPVARVEKRRIVYAHGSVHICLDRVEGLGGYVEMEYQGESLDEGREAISHLRKELGLTGNERRSYLELLLEKGL